VSFEAGMFTFLSANLSVGTRVYPERLPQDVTLPALVYQLIRSEGPTYAHEGDVGLDRIRVQFDCWADTYDGAMALFSELRSLISGFRGAWGDVEVGHCLLEGWQDDEDTKTSTHRRSADALIQYRST
jgi:hypothetical protein